MLVRKHTRLGIRQFLWTTRCASGHSPTSAWILDQGAYELLVDLKNKNAQIVVNNKGHTNVCSK